MKKWIIPALAALCICACNSNKIPDVSNIKVEVPVYRFESDFFKTDTMELDRGLDELQKKYPFFLQDFIQHIVVGGTLDTTLQLDAAIKQYIRNSRPLYDSVQKTFAGIGGLDRELKKGFQFVKYYFPDYKIPQVVTYVGLIGDPSVALTSHAMAIGLQMYAGKNFSAYNTPEAIDKFPLYISRRFAPEYIAANCFQNIAADIYPNNPQNLPLLGQMIEKGKAWYLVNKFMPESPDSLKTGYTQAQLNWCSDNEGLIWNFFLQSNNLYNTEQNIIQNYIGEAPKTDGMPDASPGNIGQWVGWQIVKDFADKNPGLTLQQVLQTDYKKIFEEAKYKPR
jgi:hypothetical protein